MSETTQTQPDRCTLRHRLFSRFGEPLFRRAEADGTPVMVVMLGEREAALPLRALQHEFSIPDESEDGRMLALIAAALDFVTTLRLGDKLPPEVLSGEASWEPEPQHRQLALAKLRLHLIAWLQPEKAEEYALLAPAEIIAAADDPALRPQLRQAYCRMAADMKLPENAISPMLDALALELSYVEALRERLLQPIQQVGLKLAHLAHGWHGDPAQLEKLGQVRRLNATALRRIGGRFEELDGQTSEVPAALRNLESQKTFIRSNRDWLYRTVRAWQPLLAEWNDIGSVYDQRARVVLEHMYHYLAPRFMPVTEWLTVSNPAGKKQNAQERRMVW